MTMTDRMRRFAPAAALAAALLLSGCAATAEGKPAPPVRGDSWLQTPAGAAPQTRDRWSLIVVFRPSSAACAEGMKDVLALQKEFGPRGLAVVGVTAAGAEEAEPFLRENGCGFPVLVDGQAVIDSFGIPEVSENHTYLLDPPGIVVVQGDLAKSREVLAKYLVKPK